MSSQVESMDAALLLDRFVSASTSEDVNASLTSILRGLQKGDIVPDEICNEIEVLVALLQVLQTNKYKDLPAEDSVAVAARIYLELLHMSTGTKNGITNLLQEPSPGRLTETCIDVASNNEHIAGPYPRVVCLQVLSAICKASPKLAQQQLMQAPNGLHRLGDLLRPEAPEQVRNEALLLASTIAEWPSAAKVWIFNEVGDIVIQTAIQEGGLTGGNVLVLDCLKLLKNLLKHDAALASLVFESAVVAPNLARLLDLRGGYSYRNPAKIEPPATIEDDDLDDLIASGRKKTNEGEKKKDNNVNNVVIPHLTQAEECIVEAVFDILGTALEDHVVKTRVWKKHLPLASLIWEMALLSPPPPGTPYPCAVPSIQLQQRALQITALYFSDPDIMDRHAGLDRLLFIVCTGGRGQTLQERLQLQQSALHVIRKTLSAERASQMLLYTQAPMMMEDDIANNADPSNRPPPAYVVKKLLNTAFENLLVEEETSSITPKPPSLPRKIFLSGSLGGLALFFTDEASRSIFFRITQASETHPENGQGKSTPSLVNAVLECLALETERASAIDDDFISLHLIRFLLSWIYEAPIVVQAILSSPHAAALSLVFYNSMSSSSDKSVVIGALINCVLGLCMEYMGDESKCGGWTISSIMEMVSSRRGGGVSQFTARLEKLKTLDHSLLSWSTCSLEWKIWNQWYDKIVLIVRKRVIQELTGGSGGGDQMSDEEPEIQTEAVMSPTKSQKSLQRLISQQSTEIEELRELLAKAKILNDSQGKQLAAWKQRAESTPNQLDEMLTEYTCKTAKLEEEIEILLKEVALKEESNQLVLKEHKDRIDEVLKELAECKAREGEMTEEQNILREEITGLNQAYKILEEEYRRVETDKAKNGSQVFDASEASQQEDQQLQVFSHAGGSTEVSTLRAENNRLQVQLQESNEWISMAIQRMEDVNLELENLRLAVRSLETEKERMAAENEAKSSQFIVAESKITELLSERDKLQDRVLELEASTVSGQNAHELQQEVVTLRNEVLNLQMHINDRDMRINSLQLQVTNNIASDTIVDEIRRRDDEIADLLRYKDESQTWMSQAHERDQVLSERVAQLTIDNHRLQGQVDSMIKDTVEASDVLHDTTRTELTAQSQVLEAELSKELEKSKAMQRELSQKEQEIQSLREELNHSLNAKINLEAQLSDHEDEYSSAIKDWEEAYAVIEEEKVKLASDCQTAFSERDELKAAILDCRNHADELCQILSASISNQETTSDSPSNLVTTTEDVMRRLKLAVEDLNKQLKDQEQEALEAVGMWQRSYYELEDRLREVGQGITEVDVDKGGHIRSQNDTILDLERSIKKLEEELLRRTSENCDLRAIYNVMEVQFTESQSDKEKLLERLQSLEKEAQESVDMWQRSYYDLENKVKATEGGPANAGDGDNGHFRSQNDTVVAFESSIKKLEEKLDRRTVEKNDLQASYNMLEAQFAESQSDLEKLRERLQYLQTELELRRQQQSVGEGTMESNITDHQVQTLPKLTQSESNQVEELTNKVEKLENDLASVTQEAEEAVAAWQSQCAELEMQANVLQEQVAGWEQRFSEMELQGEVLMANESQQNDPSFQPALNDDILQLKADNQTLRTEVDYLKSQLGADAEYVNGLINQLNSNELQLKDMIKESNQCCMSLRNLLEQMDTSGAKYHPLDTEKLVDGALNSTDLDKTLYYEAAEVDGEHSDVDKSTSFYHDVNMEDTTKLIKLLSERWNVLLDHVRHYENQKRPALEESDDCAATKRSVDKVEELESTVYELRRQLEHQNLLLSETETNFEKIVYDRDMRIKSLMEEIEKGFIAANAWKSRADELEADIKIKEYQLHDQQEAHELSVEQWQQSYNELESRYDEVTDIKEELRIELRDLKSERPPNQESNTNDETAGEMGKLVSSPSEKGQASTQLEEEVKGLRAEIRYLEEQLTEAEDVIHQWQRSYESVVTELESMKSDKELSKETFICNGLESRIEKTHPVNEEPVGLEGNTLRSQKEPECSEAQILELTAKLHAANEKTTHLESRLSAYLEKAFLLEQQLEKVKEQNQLLQERSEVVFNQELEKDVIKREIECERDSRRNAESRFALLEKEMADNKETFLARIEEVEAEKDSIISSLEREKITCTDRLNNLEHDMNNLQSINTHLELEKSQLNDKISVLMRELQEANTAMQVFVTNARNEKASLEVAEVLRQQLDDALREAETAQHTVSVEVEKRLGLEKEVSSLKEDLAALLGLEYNESNQPEIQRRTVEAVEALQKNERAELQSLKETLERAMSELADARKIQKDLEEKLAACKHQAIIYEQKVIESRNEFLLLTKSLDDIRSTESSRRASLEYRIASLENDAKVKRLRYLSEQENLQNELSQTSLERDRLFLSLKESEKRNESIMQSLSCKSSDDAGIDLPTECRKLHSEKSFLLLSMSEETSKMERRLREAREAEKAFLESDVILERELRFAAENALENLRRELNELKHDESKNASTDVKINLNKESHKELEEAFEKIETLTSENFSLRDRLEINTREAQASIDRLQAEAHQAKARAIHYEKAGHFEAEVHLEQARLQGSHTIGYSNHVSFSDASAAEESKENLGVVKLYDIIKKQSEEIEEERSVYMQINSKNDELLTLVAQLSILKNVLQKSLLSHVGYDAMEAAVREAEEKVVADFGQPVKFL